MSNILITKRDIDILNWINGAGFVNIEQIAERYKISTSTAYGRMRKLVIRGVLIFERMAHNQPGHYRVTKLGASFSPWEMPPIRHVSWGSYEHSKLIVDLSIKLVQKYQCSFMSEREWRYELDFLGIGRRGHLCDGVLLKDDKKIAIEVELTTKGKRRLNGIIKDYVKNFTFDEVWYFCGSSAVIKLIKSHVESHEFIKVFSLKEALNNSV